METKSLRIHSGLITASDMCHIDFQTTVKKSLSVGLICNDLIDTHNDVMCLHAQTNTHNGVQKCVAERLAVLI